MPFLEVESMAIILPTALYEYAAASCWKWIATKMSIFIFAGLDSSDGCAGKTRPIYRTVDSQTDDRLLDRYVQKFLSSCSSALENEDAAPQDALQVDKLVDQRICIYKRSVHIVFFSLSLFYLTGSAAKVVVVVTVQVACGRLLNAIRQTTLKI